MTNFFYLVIFLINVTYFSSAFANEKPLVVVGCSGKTGSTSLTRSFQYMGYEAVHTHKVDAELFNYIFKESERRPIIIIDSIREPIARRISSFFQNLGSWMDKKSIIEAYKSDRWGFIDYLIECFNKKFLELENYYSFDDWKGVGYDVLNHKPFNLNTKYQIHNINNIFFVNIRFEDINHWERIIKSMGLPLDLSKFVLVKINVTSTKFSDLPIYDDFLKRVTFSREAFNQIYSDHKEAMAHFYTDEAISNFRKKWEKHLR